MTTKGKTTSSSKYDLPNDEPTLSGFVSVTTYLGYAVLVIFGHLRDFFGKVTGKSRYFNTNSTPPPGYAPLLQDWENFYTRRLFHRIQDCWNRPIDGPPYSGKLEVVERVSNNNNHSMSVPKDFKVRKCINLGSYNYLGFSDDWDISCKAEVMDTLEKYPLSLCTSFAEGGYLSLHKEVEKSVADFVGKEDAIIFNMGWATNAFGIPSLAGKGCLIISDSLNHNSIVAGARTSGATIRVFKHNDLNGLENLVRQAIAEGQDRTHRPWRKIIIAIEGIYSMEGQLVDLRGVVDIAKRYKCYTYLDEAHSIGATGETGRGVCEYMGVDPKDVDILMGTFTKSYGAMGGYIAGDADFIAHVRANNTAFLIDNAMSPVVAQQILTSFAVIKEATKNPNSIGAKKLERLKDNANYFRERLIDMGVEIVGHRDSPVIPMMLYNPTKIAAFSRECFKENLAVVVVGFPATPLLHSRARFCVSAGHTREELDRALEIIDRVTDKLKLKYKNSPIG